ncbi:MAG: hypothetical protein IT495_16185 [Gammaproteobacteria bacterium]|nr:hypothetical protein [Gammaproteobacteria bacterium]
MEATRPATGRAVALPLASAVVTAITLGGCASVGAALTSDFATGAGVLSYIATGKSLSDHALSTVAHRDCSLVNGIIDRDRDICEQPGSPAVDTEFRGLLALLGHDRGRPAAAPGVYEQAPVFADVGPPPDSILPGEVSVSAR